MVIACLIWGFSALYYKVLAHIPPIEILAHRTIWSFVLFAILLLAQGRLSALFTLLSTRNGVLVVGLAAIMISTNWFAFIFSIQAGYAVEAAMGYYIFPLVAVLLGRLVFGEKLQSTQWAAVGLAALGVVTLTYGLGVAPWISLLVAGSFGIYGVLKKRLSVGPVVSVTGEVALLFPIALGVLAFVHSKGEGHFGTAAWENGMLIFFRCADSGSADAVFICDASQQAFYGWVVAIHQPDCAIFLCGGDFWGALWTVAWDCLWPDMARTNTIFRFQPSSGQSAA